MKPSIKNALGLILCACGLALFGALICAAGFLRSSTVASDQTSVAVAQVNAALSGKMKNHHDGILWLMAEFLKNADASANQLKQTMQDANAIAKEQRPKTAALTDATVAFVKSGNETVTKLGTAAITLDAALKLVNTETIPKVTLAATDALAAYAALPRSFHPTIANVNRLSGPILANSLGTIAAFKLTAGETERTMKTVREAAPQLAASAVNVGKSADGIAADIHSITTDIAKPKGFFAKLRAWAETAGKILARFI
jgi:hypothetical protein